MTIREKINEIIDRYYDDEEDRYSTCREDEVEDYEMKDELEEFLTSNNIEHKVEEDGFESTGIDTYFIAVAFIDENSKLDLITVYLEDCMIKVEEIVEKYKGYEVDEEKLKEFLVPPKPKTVWDLKIKDNYWYINDYNDNVKATWDNVMIDNYRRNMGNCFLTKEEAEFEVERRRVEAILLKYGRRKFKYSENNYYMDCEDREQPFEIYCCSYSQTQGVIYFDTEELCQKAIDEAGKDNIKKYIFGVDSK